MIKKAKPFIIVLAFWLIIFMFILGTYSGEYSMTSISGNAVSETGAPTPLGAHALAIVILFFTNIVTLFFLIREKLK